MRVVCRPLAPREIDHELLWLSVSLGGLGLAAGWLAAGLPWPSCFFHAVTGHPCLTCGATRSAIAFFHGNFAAAWKWNPLAFTIYTALSIFDGYAFAVLVLRRPRLRIVGLTNGEKAVARIGLIALLALNWAYVWQAGV